LEGIGVFGTGQPLVPRHAVGVGEAVIEHALTQAQEVEVQQELRCERARRGHDDERAAAFLRERQEAREFRLTLPRARGTADEGMEERCHERMWRERISRKRVSAVSLATFFISAGRKSKRS